MRKSVLCGVLLLLFGKMVSAQQTLSLQECRDLAVKNNKELRIAEEKIRMADYEKKAALTKYFPQISANGAYMWNQKDLNLLDMGQLSSSLASSLGGLAQLPVVQQTVGAINDLQHLDIQNVWVGNVALVQPVFMSGKIVTYNQITAYAKELAMSMNDQKLQDLLYKTDETYWQVVSLVNKKKLADAYVELLRKTDEDMAALIAEGVATQADGLSVKVKLNEAEMAQTKVNNGLALSRMLLAQLCGLPLTDTLTLADEQLDNFPVEERTTSVDMNQAFMNRNELKSLDLASKIYKKKERIVLADLLPTVAFSANYFVTNPNLFNGYKNDFAGMFNL
ncbi:MAG: TolC family protein, partial [Parabacteroides sp.]|nr:TolC family protein [Parabacteroides sp.]